MRSAAHNARIYHFHHEVTENTKRTKIPFEQNGLRELRDLRDFVMKKIIGLESACGNNLELLSSWRGQSSGDCSSGELHPIG